MKCHKSSKANKRIKGKVKHTEMASLYDHAPWTEILRKITLIIFKPYSNQSDYLK